ncbi:MAG: 5'-3' exonuclease [Solirubrobacteraceae bacterium]
MGEQPLLVVDTPWLLYRSFFALPRSIRDSEDRPTGALLGTVNTILTAIDALRPRAVVCCLGAEEAEYRVALYPSYHAHRDPMPDELRAQWEKAPGLLAAFGWTIAAHDRLEADDLLGSFARIEGQAGGRTLILTGDRDLYQAVDERTAVLEMKKNEPPVALDVAEVRARYGVTPEQVPDLIALRGDPSDGLPGAKGIGAKTAADLLREYGSLERVIASANRQRPRIGAALREQADELRDFLRIATLVEVEVELPPDTPTDRSAGAAAARRLGMERLAARLEQP